MPKLLILLFFATFSALNIYAEESQLKPEENIATLKTLYNEEKYEAFLSIIENIKDKKTNNELIYFTLGSYFHTGEYKNLEKLHYALPPYARNSLFIKELRMRAFFARKYYSSVIKLLDEIEKENPLYYEQNALICIRADIELYRKHYSAASDIYDECLKINENENTLYNAIKAKSKGKKNHKSLLSSYIDFIQKFPASRYNESLIQILSNVKRKYDLPNETSPLFSSWLNVMRKSEKLDEFFKDKWMNLEHPASMEIIRYLEEKEKYEDSVKYIDKMIDSGKIQGSLYYYVWQKFKILKNWKGPEEASLYLYEYSSKLNSSNKETALFYAALGYFEAGTLDKAEEILLNEFILKNRKSEYYTTAIHKLGLIYLLKGETLKTYALWTAWITIASKKRDSALVKEMQELLAIVSSESIPWLTDTPEQEKIVDYYDLINYENTDIPRPYLKDFGTCSDTLTWETNKREKSPQLKDEIVKSFSKTPAKYREEPYIMMKDFAEKDFKEGLFFYARNIGELASFAKNKKDDEKEPQNTTIETKTEKESVKETKAAYYIDMNRYMRISLSKLIYEYLNIPSATIDYSYYKIIKDLTYSPKEGGIEEWKLLYPTPYLDEILKISKELDLSPAMIYAIMRSETFYRANLVSPVGAQGLMQIMPKTLKKIAAQSGTEIKNSFNPYENLRAAAWYMKKLLERFDGNILLAAAAYNAGPHRVSDWLQRYPEVKTYLFIELIPFKETRNYVKKVMKYYHIYTYIYENRTPCLGTGEILNVKENPDAVDF